MGGSQRLQLARRLLEDGEVDRALEFAAPALDSVNVDLIFFLSALREKNGQAGDTAFATLLARAARDPNSDANTVSGLSSYLFTPFLYVTFERSGGANQNRQREPTPAPPVSSALLNSFLKVAFQILMQPSPAPDQDRTTSGSTGKYLVIKRLPQNSAFESERATDMLEEALAESRRISASDPDRARALTGVAVGFAEIDRVRAWEIVSEVVKAANNAEAFTGEDSQIYVRLQTKMMVVMNAVTSGF